MVKTLRSVILLLWITLLLGFQSGDSDTWAGISRALNSGNAVQLSSWFSTTVSVSLPERKGSFSTVQARSIMQEFFRLNPAASFTLQNTGETANNGRFCLGTYVSATGDNFSVYVLVQPIKGKDRITRITFETN